MHRLVRGNTMTPTFTRGPGEAAGVFTLECALDELASQLQIDPVELRLRNLAEADPNTGNPWSSFGLRECLQRGAARIGWEHRNPAPRSERDGNWLIGTGMAAAAYPIAFFMRTQRARAHLYADGSAVVQTSAQEFGTGMTTMLTQVAADALGIGLDGMRVEFGDTDYPATGSPVGSNGAMMVSAAVHNAGLAVRDQLIALAAGDAKSPLHGADPAAITVASGRMTLTGDPGTGETYAALMGRHRMNDAEAIGSWDPPPPDTPHGLLTFGAQFAKVAVDADLGIIRVRHLVGAFAPGRVLNPKTARSQLMGGMLWGMSQALLEGARMDPPWPLGERQPGRLPRPRQRRRARRRRRLHRGSRPGHRPARGQGRGRDRAGRLFGGDRQRGLPRHRLPGPRTAHRRRAPAASPAGMTSSAPRRADFHGSGADSPLPERPLLTTPPRLQPPDAAGEQRQRLASQPWSGLGGLLLTAVVFFALALGTGSTATALLILGPISAFALPAVAMIAFWWNDWPGSRLSVPWTGLIDTALFIAAAIAATIAGQAIVERPDVLAVFETASAPATFPATLPLAGGAFTAMLQLTLPCERWPLGGIGRLRSGVAALALSWALGTGAYFLFVNLDAVPAAGRAAAGLHNPGGPIPAADFGSALIAVGVWQALFFIALRGWPVNTITRRPKRLIAGNILVIGPGALTYLLLRDIAHWQPDAISAACGCVLAAVLVVGMLFEGWPAAQLPAAPGRLLTLALTALVAVALDRALATYANTVTWIRATPDDWVTTAALSFLGVGIISHVAVGLRWPFTLKTKKQVTSAT
ncbi:MAG: molybdopterin cofactor-binding domain-containing protein [Trebonia sp.]